MPVPAPHPYNHDDHFARWQAHLDAGRLGANPPAPPEVVANRAATDALFRAIAADRRALDRAACRECRA